MYLMGKLCSNSANVLAKLSEGFTDHQTPTLEQDQQIQYIQTMELKS
jgi:hypothetical protein